jgi:hypothetical protein
MPYFRLDLTTYFEVVQLYREYATLEILWSDRAKFQAARSKQRKSLFPK